MSDLAERRLLNRGYSDGFTRALEVVLTPLILGGLGALVDGRVGTRPWFTIALATAGVAGIFTKLWLGYDREMREHEANGAWKRRTVPVTGFVTAARALRPATPSEAAAPEAAAPTGDEAAADASPPDRPS